MLLFVVLFVLVPSAAHASAGWSAPVAIDSSELLSVSCSSDSFCVAVDAAGNAVTFNGTEWSAPLKVDGSTQLNSVSCPSSSFCVAVDEAGDAVTFNGTSWGAPEAIDSGTALSSVSCVSSSFCVAVDDDGGAVVLSGSAWGTPTSIDAPDALSSVSCSSPTFCVAVDTKGNEVTYGSGGWDAPTSLDPTRSLSSVSCASASFCLAVDSNAYYVTYVGSSWSTPEPMVFEQLSSVSCPSPSFCAAVNDGNGLAITFDGTEWGPNPISSIEPGGFLRSVSCPSSAFCATVDDAGNVLMYGSSSGSTGGGGGGLPTGGGNGLYGFSIDGGAVATNTLAVELTFSAPPDASQAAVSNDSGFGSAGGTRPVSVGAVPWALEQPPSNYATLTVYARFLAPDWEQIPYSSSIIYDTALPTMQSASVATVGSRRIARAARVRLHHFALRVKAKDPRVGVCAIATSTSTRHRARRETITMIQSCKRLGVRHVNRVIRLRLASAPRFVRVRNSAGDWSHWLAVKHQHKAEL